MFSKLKKSESYIKTIVILGIVSVFAGLLSVIVSDIFLPIAAALFACTLLFDQSKKKWISLVFILSLFVIFPFLDLSFLLFALIILAASFVLFFGYKKGLNKAEISLYLSALFIICMVGALYLTGAKEISNYSASAVFEYYKTAMDTFREQLLAELASSLTQQQGELEMDPEQITEMVEVLFVGLTNLFFALLSILGFFYAGIQIKVFTHVSRRLEEAPRPRRSWHFGLSNLFAYFYVGVFLLSTFFGAMDSVFSITLMNLYYIFLAVFAYVGFNYAFAMTARARNKRLMQLVLIFSLVMMNVLALQILSFVGVFITTMHNKFLRMSTPGSDEPKGE